MKISHSWLQKYFAQPLPSPEKLGELFTMHSFEIESIDDVGGDKVFDVKVLPNRAHDCLCHRGVAVEVAALTGLPMTAVAAETTGEFSSSGLSVVRTDPQFCARYSAAIIEGVKVGPSPVWLQEKLASLGQRSINNVVDALNYVMFDMGQPLHAFDAALLSTNGAAPALVVRSAHAGEEIELLDGKTYTLQNSVSVIATEAGQPLAVAGVKGGTHAQVTETTTTLVLESAHFDAVSIRKTAKALGLRTDASVRYENGYTPHATLDALQEAAALVVALAGGTITAVVDSSEPLSPAPTITIEHSAFAKLLGVEISLEKVVSMLRSLGCEVVTSGTTITVVPPVGRLDLNIEQDIIDEVGRLHGYFTIAPIKPEGIAAISKQDARTVAIEKIKHACASVGADEIYTYAFQNTGEVELENPLAQDKRFLRSTMIPALKESLARNVHNAPLTGNIDFIFTFEIGTVFARGAQDTYLGIAIAPVKKMKKSDAMVQAKIDALVAAIFEMSGVSLEIKVESGVGEVSLEALLAAMQDTSPLLGEVHVGKKFQKISPYPFMLRDIAVFVPPTIEASDVLAVIETHATELLVRTTLFDVFEKTQDDGTVKKSYAYNLVFQSEQKTLSDDEINVIMQKITDAMNAREGWLVR